MQRLQTSHPGSARHAGQLLHSVYRIVLRGGSPQRIPYSDGLYVSALLGFVLLAAGTHRLVFEAGVLDVGVLLFACLTGIYLVVALLTRRVPRARLRPSLLAFWLVLAGSQLLLLIGGLALRWLHLSGLTGWLAALTGMIILAGTTNVLRFAAQIAPAPAAALVLLTAGALAAFYLTLSALLGVVFA